MDGDAALPQTDRPRATTRLKQLIHRQGKVLSVMHPPTAALARIMEQFGLRGAVRRHQRGGRRLHRHGGCRHRDDDRMRPDRRLDREQRDRRRSSSTATPAMAASWRCAVWCATASTPASPASASTISRSRASARTQSAGLEVVPLEQAIVRYRAAVDMKNELDPDFVDHGAVLRARCGEWRTGRHAAAACGLSPRGRCRLGTA